MMLVPVITGLLGVSLGGASLPAPQYFETASVERLVLAAPEIPDFNPRLRLVGLDGEVVRLHQAQVSSAVPDATRRLQADLLKILPHAEDLTAKVSSVACYLTRPRGTRFTPTDKAPYGPLLFLTVTVGPCSG